MPNVLYLVVHDWVGARTRVRLRIPSWRLALQHLTFRLDWETVVGTVIDAALHRPEIDPPQEARSCGFLRNGTWAYSTTPSSAARDARDERTVTPGAFGSGRWTGAVRSRFEMER